MSVIDIPIEDAPPGQEPPPLDFDGGWKRNKAGREYVQAVGRRGVVYRQGDETIAQALARDAAPAPQNRPRRKSTPKTPPPPKGLDLKALEQQLAEALKAPAVPAAMFGDEWAANHFTQAGPYLARNLVLASETNPWLRRKLENAATGGDMMMQLMSLVGVGGALIMYVVPPVVWWFNLPLPEAGRQMLGIPERHSDGSPDYPEGA